MDGISVTVNSLPENDEDMLDPERIVSEEFSQPMLTEGAPIHGRETIEQTELVLDGQGQGGPKTGDARLKRPALHREKSVPLSQQPLPPVPPQGSQDAGDPTNSLSLMQLKRLVADMPREEQAPYDFTYDDTSSFQEEVEELFTYKDEEHSNLLHARSVFDQQWSSYVRSDEDRNEFYVPPSWVTTDIWVKREFLSSVKSDLGSDNVQLAIMALVYLALGCWYDTALKDSKPVGKAPSSERYIHQAAEMRRFSTSATQVTFMQENISLIAEEVGVQPIFDAFRQACLDEL